MSTCTVFIILKWSKLCKATLMGPKNPRVRFFYGDFSVLYKKIRKINWGIFYSGLLSTMIIAFEYVHRNRARARTFQDKKN